MAPLRRLRNARRVYRPIFVAGAAGSGTTLLAFSLGQRFECAGLIEEGAIQVGEHSFLHVRHPDTFPSVDAYLESMRPRADWSVERARADMLAMYRSFATAPGRVAIDKGPNAHLLRASFLARCFPEAHHLMVFRDPVVNVEGLRRKWARFRQDSLDASIRFWARLHETFLDGLEELGDRVTVVRYEDLVERYDEVMEALAQRLALEPARRWRRLPERANVEGQGIRNVHRGEIGVVRSANERAYERLEADTVARIVDALADVRARLESVSLRS